MHTPPSAPTDLPRARSGDCFIVMDLQGLVWTGSDWSVDRTAAERFDAQPDPHGKAKETMQHLRREGRKCWVVYVSADQTEDFFARRLSGKGEG